MKPELSIVKKGDSPAGVASPPLRRWFDEFVSVKRASVSKKSLAKYVTAIEPYIKHVGEKYWPPTRFDVVDYLTTVRERTSDMTAHIYWSTLRSWLNYIELSGGFGDYPNPATQLRDMHLSPKAPKPKPKGIREAHLKMLFKMLDGLPDTATNRRDATMIYFIWRTGARSGEASGLRRDQLFLEDHTAILSEKETKDREERKLVFGRHTRERLADWLKHLDGMGYKEKWIFPSVGHAGKVSPGSLPMTVDGTRQMFQRRCAQAGIPQYTVHELRHTFTKDALAARKNPDSIRRQLGHSDMRMTLYYAKEFDDGQDKDFRDFGD